MRRSSAWALVGLIGWTSVWAAPSPVVFDVRFSGATSQVAEISATYPVAKAGNVTLRMPVWSPGYYRVENYAQHVRDFTATTLNGTALAIGQPRHNRWVLTNAQPPAVRVSYRLRATGRSVTTCWVDGNYAVLNPGAAFPELLGTKDRSYEVRLHLPTNWNGAATGLPAAPGGHRSHFVAADYETLVDSPIVAGTLQRRAFTVSGVPHEIVDVGQYGAWDADRAASDIEKIVRQNEVFWGVLPFQRYVFLNAFRPGGGGLEHRDSTLLTSSPVVGDTAKTPDTGWLRFVCHEYFHAYNVKRLRPAEFDPFDYEQPPRTSSLWVSEGITTYYGELLVFHAGLAPEDEFLHWLSGEIQRLQSSPGRRVQSLANASLQVWDTPTSGLPRDAGLDTISYYVKGPLVAFLLDAEIQRATDGRRSLQDAMRLAYRRYSGPRGFTPEQFRNLCSGTAGKDLEPWFQRSVFSTEELDYAPALEWFGLRFFTGEATDRWTLELDPQAPSIAHARWKRLVGSP